MEPQSRPDSPQIKLPKKPTGNFRLTKDRKISEPLVRSTAIDSKDGMFFVKLVFAIG